MFTNRNNTINSKNKTYKRLMKNLVPHIYLSPTIILMTVLMVIPIAMVILYTLMDNVIMNQNPVLIFGENYIDILTDSVFHQSIKNTLYFTAVSVIQNNFTVEDVISEIKQKLN